MIPYDYEGVRGEGVLRGWARDTRESRRIQQHVWLVIRHSPEMALNSIYFPVDKSERKPGIYYAKIKTSRQLRPRLCLGPVRPTIEITYLIRAIEEDGYRIVPSDATDTAFQRSREVAADPNHRRQRLTPPRTAQL